VPVISGWVGQECHEFRAILGEVRETVSKQTNEQIKRQNKGLGS
jgi:hypothetical protein